jgi:hypothetical protein
MPKLKSYEWEHQQALQAARGLTRYYQARIQEGDLERWQTGLDVASGWLKLLEDGTQNPRDFDNLVQLAEGYSESGSAALDLLWRISWWQEFLQIQQKLQSQSGEDIWS